ncbi:MAG: peptidylprolyl isomerase [Candidatus Binatia bacterium]
MIALLPLTLLACDGSDVTDSASAPPDAEAVAVVNGEPISRADFKAYLAEKQSSQTGIQTDPQTALDEMINMELIRQEAIAQGIDQREDVQAELRNQRTQLLVNTLVSERIAKFSFSEEELRKEYEKQTAQMPRQEYKARHILVQTEAEARAIIDRLAQGEDFIELAKTESIDPAGPEGGDLGWFHPNSMVPPFAEAVQKLEKGQYSKEPVETEFGWHIILLEDTRPMELPAFEEVQDRLDDVLVNQSLQRYLDELRAEAEIEVNLPDQPAPESGASTN